MTDDEHIAVALAVAKEEESTAVLEPELVKRLVASRDIAVQALRDVIASPAAIAQVALEKIEILAGIETP